ncbi:sialidase family protein [Brachyspira aalborgi]|uniref:exo-alpha-sialidase n=1 Tax=Brachyspira aalborgi TaxID=29522 RepID=A0A5C8G364_9SPIR|nr:sialidase family protein [Brachyspira aalborgi]TXJ56400.1 exo-alpha-sialidase [Brachyspira aalborgi]
MRKRYFFIPLISIIVISGVLVWACKHPFGDGLSIINIGKKVDYSIEEGGPGYKGEIGKEVTNSTIIPNKVEVFPLKSGNDHYRIPTLIQLTNGDLLAFADKRIGGIGDVPKSPIETVYKKSTNNGKTWSQEKRISPQSTSKSLSYGDGAYCVDRKTGNIICLVIGDQGFLSSTPNNPIRTRLIIGRNNGSTWDAPIDITDQIYGVNCKDPVRKTWHGVFAASGNGVQLRNGRMLFVLNVRESAQPFARNYVMYSDDGGDTWKVSKNAPRSSSGGDEAKIVELNDGSLIMAIRPKDIYQRRLAKSTDNGETWGPAEHRKDLPSSASNGDIIYYTSTLNGFDKNRIITMFDSRPWKVGGGSPPGDPVLYWSYDEGKTWKGKQMHSGNAGYSSLAILKDGSIGILAEIGGSWNGPIYFMRVNMKYLTSNRDKGPFYTNQTATNNNSKVK